MKEPAKTRNAAAKPKLMLSVRPRYVAMLRRASVRRGKTITEVVEEMAEELEEKSGSSKPLWADRMR